MSTTFDILTIFPEAFTSYFTSSVLGRAQAKKIIRIHAHNLRDYTRDKHKKVDDKPYGGGAGMVLMAEPILKAVEGIGKSVKPTAKSQTKIVVLSAKGKQFNQKLAYDWAKKYHRIILISGRYEGIDERAIKALRAEEISIGPYVLTDGDVAAMVIVSSVARLVPGVIKLESLKEESHWNLLLKREKNTLGPRGLEYPHYTRPEIITWKGKTYRVPKILLSGDHQKIEEWRKKVV